MAVRNGVVITKSTTHRGCQREEFCTRSRSGQWHVVVAQVRDPVPDGKPTLAHLTALQEPA